MSQPDHAARPDPASARILRQLWARLEAEVAAAAEHGSTITVVVEVAPGGRVRPSSQVMAPWRPASERSA